MSRSIAALATAALIVVSCTRSAAATSEERVGDAALGERIYLHGTLPDGEPVRATVAGDVPVQGTMFACVRCHLRSGQGSQEGALISPPVTWRSLSVPRAHGLAWRGSNRTQPGSDAWEKPPPWFDAGSVREGHTEESVIRAIRHGVDPAGKTLNAAMPRYELSDADAGHLVAYLRTLSAAHSEGVTDTTIRFATVIAPEVPADETEAMLSVLQAYVDSKNSQTRGQEQRAAAGPFYRREDDAAYRRLSLAVWRLEGRAQTWERQLEAYYREEPVFALLGGIGHDSWAPVHRFCERMRIPQLLPIADEPVLSEDDWYTLYFSRGTYAEGATAARHVRREQRTATEARVLQVSRDGGTFARAAQGFTDTWRALGGKHLTSERVGADAESASKRLAAMLESERPDVLVLWLDADVLAGALAAVTEAGGPDLVVASATLLGGRFDSIPDRLRGRSRLTYPGSLPGEKTQTETAVRRWLQIRDLPLAPIDIRSKMYLLGWMLSGALKSMRGEFFRDYLLDSFDMMVDQDYAIVAYPRLSFGPGQRYAAKGCYVVGVTVGPDPQPIQLTDWVVY